MMIKELRNIAPGALEKRYGESITNDLTEYQVLEQIAIVRKCFKKGEEPDMKKASAALRESRSGIKTASAPVC